MKKCRGHLKNILITLGILSISFLLTLALEDAINVQGQGTTVFVFAVFLVSFLTEGYVYGIVAAFAGTIAVNYAFTFPYFDIDFAMTENLVSGLVMIIISVLTSTLVTKLKRQETIKAESERERMRANLLRAVSHDLRTPLTTIYGSAAALLENGESLTEEQKKLIINGIKEDSQWLIQMVENLLSVTRIDSGRVRISKTPTVLEELIDSVLLKFRKRYPAQKVEVRIPDEIVMIPMDAILIEQVIMNILENAVHHAENMTTIEISVLSENKKAVFEIKDNGCGLREGSMEKLFTGYYDKVEISSDGRSKNTGIGLSVCATIIKAHGGRIEAENSPGGGAVFRFVLDTEEIDGDKQ